MGEYLYSKLIFMNTKQINIEYHYKSAFASHEDLRILAAAGYSLALAVRFPYPKLAQKESSSLHNKIRKFISLAHDPYLGYQEFCERIMLGSGHLKRSGGIRSSTTLMEWFEPGTGFDKTKPAHEHLVKKRIKKTGWKKNWAALAEAILEIQETPTPLLLKYWEEWLSSRGAIEELKILHIVIKKRVVNI